MTTMTLPHKNGSSAYSAADAWLQSSVQTFFTAFNWEDQPADVQDLKVATALDGGTVPLSMALSVSQFFATVNWDGSEIAAVVPAQDTLSPAAEDEFTLESFSDLF